MAPKNDFLFSYNWLAQKRTEEILVFLNNDLKVDPDFLVPLLRHFESPDVFSVSARSYDWNGDGGHEWPGSFEFNNGFYSWKFDTNIRRAVIPCLPLAALWLWTERSSLSWADLTGCFCLHTAKMWISVFEHGVRGWRCIYEPDSHVWHRHQATWSNHSKGSLNSLELRNSLLMQWSTFPMRRGRVDRLQSLLKLLIGSFF